MESWRQILFTPENSEEKSSKKHSEKVKLIEIAENQGLNKKIYEKDSEINEKVKSYSIALNTSDGTRFILTIKKNGKDEIEFLCFSESIQHIYFTNHFSFHEIVETECFRVLKDGKIREIFELMVELSEDENIKINVNKKEEDQVLILTFSDIYRTKNLKTQFYLGGKEIKDEKYLEILSIIHKINSKANREHRDENEKLNNENIKLLKIVKNLLIPEYCRLLKPQDFDFFYGIFQTKFSFFLIYDSDRHGNLVKNTMERITNISNLLILFETDKGRIFGGFSPYPLRKKEDIDKNKYKINSNNYGGPYGYANHSNQVVISENIFYRNFSIKEFIFSLTKKKVFNRAKDNLSDKLVFECIDENYFPIFGKAGARDSWDIFVHQDSFTTNSPLSGCSLGKAFGVDELNCLDEDKDVYLTGGKEFKIVRIEILEVK